MSERRNSAKKVINFKSGQNLSLDDMEPNYDWQASKNQLKERAAFLFNNKLMADVHFVVGKEARSSARIPAHKFLLSMGSSVFQKMFYGSLPMNSDEIKVPELEPEAFLTLLKFVSSIVCSARY